MADKDFSKLQKDVCEITPDPAPIKKICPTCIENPQYVEPNWLSLVNEAYLNEKTCEYMVTVFVNKYSETLNARQFREYGLGKDAALRSYVEPALRIMLRKFGKLEANQIICASIDGLKLSGLATEELLEIYDDYGAAYARWDSDAANPSRVPPCRDIDVLINEANQKVFPQTTQTTENGDTFKIYSPSDYARGDFPEITNPFALELYAYPKRFDIDPIQNLLKVNIAIPAFIFDQVPEAPVVASQRQGGTSQTSFELILNADEFRGQVKRLKAALKQYGDYQSLFWQQNDAFLIFRDSEVDYYAIHYSADVDNFYDSIYNLIDSNGYSLNPLQPSVGNKISRIRITFKPDEVYVIEKIEVDVCGQFRELKSGVSSFINDYSSESSKTVLHYIANLKSIDYRLQARQTQPWLDFLVEYTFPPLHVVYGKLSTESVRESTGDCVVGNTEQFFIDMKDYVLNESLKLSDAIAYEFSKQSCTLLDEELKIHKLDLNDTQTLAFESAVDKYYEQDTFLTSLIDADSLKTGDWRNMVKVPSAGKPTDKTSSLLKKLSICNLKSMTTASINCLLSGTTYENGIAKIVEAALRALDIDLLAFFIENLPPDKQLEIRQKYEKDFADFPLPWEAGYNPGTINSTNPYEKYKSSTLKRLEGGQSAEVQIEQFNKLIAIQAVELQASRERISRLEGDIVDQQNILEVNPSLTGNARVLAALEKSLAQELQDKEDIENIIKTLQKDVESIKNSPAVAAWKALPENEKELLTEQAKKEAANPDSAPGTYGNILGEMSVIITEAYIEYILDVMEIDDLINFLERIPGADLIPRFFPIVGCSEQELLTEPIEEFFKSLTYDLCGDTKTGIRAPEVPLLPQFFDSSLLTTIGNLFKEKFEKVLGVLLIRLVIKLLETIDSAICDSLNALSTFVADGLTDGGEFTSQGLDDAFRDAFCPNGDTDDLQNTKNGIFNSVGGNGMSQNSFDCAFNTINAVSSKKENLQLLLGVSNRNASRRIAESVNAFCPEFSDYLGDPNSVENFYAQCGSFIPPQLRDILLSQIETVPDGPIIESICLTQEELDAWNENRENLLVNNGLDRDSARDMLDKANERILDDLGSLAEILQKGPDGILGEAIADLMSLSDPNCEVNRSAITLETPESRAQKVGLINGFFKPLESKFFGDLIGDFTSVFGGILRDTQDSSLNLHEQFVNLPLFFPNYVNTEQMWDVRRSEREEIPLLGGVIAPLTMPARPLEGITDILNPIGIPNIPEPVKPLMRGMFPDTVGIWMRKTLLSNSEDLEVTSGQVTNALNFSSFNDNISETVGLALGGASLGAALISEGLELLGVDGVPEFAFRQNLTRRNTNNLNYNLTITYTDYNFFGVEEDTQTIEVDYEKQFNFSEDIYSPPEDLSPSLAPAADVFRTLIENSISGSVTVSIDNLNSAFKGINNTALNFVKESMLVDKRVSDEIPVGYKFGYDIDQKIDFKDLTYVNPEADPDDLSTWFYNKNEDERILGKSATENPRVHFLDPAIHGGSYRRPKIYIEPATYNGWLGMMRTFVPEVGTCEDGETNFLDLTSVTNRVKEVEDNLPFDERLSLPPDCRIELPFDRQFSPSNHGLMEGVVISTVRVYVTEFILRTLPIFSTIEMTSRNIEDLFIDFLVDRMEEEMIQEDAFLNVIEKYTYWLLFLEQSYQVVERRIIDELMESTPELEDARSKIVAAKEDYSPYPSSMKSVDDVARGAYLIAYNGEDPTTTDILRQITALGGIQSVETTIGQISTYLSPARSRLANKINSIHNAKDSAKLFLREIVRSEIEFLSSKLNFNLRPRARIFDINKMALGRFGLTKGSSLKSGESEVENPVVEGQSGRVYGEILDVPSNILTESALDGVSFTAEEFSNANDQGVFYLERYIRATDKDDDDKIFNVKEFQDFLSDRSLFEPDNKLSDYFGNLDFADESQTELIGSLGVKFGVRLIYCPPSSFSLDLSNVNASLDRAYIVKQAAVNVDGTEMFLAPTINPVPLVSFEHDVFDKKISEVDYNDDNFGEELKCYVDELVQKEEFKILFEHCFPLKTYVSSFATYSYYAFFESIGKDPSENAELKIPGIQTLTKDLWKGEVFRDSKSKLRSMFNSVYRSDDDDPIENEINRSQEARAFFKNVIPELFYNLDPNIPGRTTRRIVEDKPFDADGKDCKNQFQKLFDREE